MKKKYSIQYIENDNFNTNYIVILYLDCNIVKFCLASLFASDNKRKREIHKKQSKVYTAKLCKGCTSFKFKREKYNIDSFTRVNNWYYGEYWQDILID